jgi:NDP-sugar pyrophosphorylase family protein
MLLAAGLGTRMEPLTSERAKPALRLFDIPLAVWPMAFLARAGVTRLVVNLHHLPETLEPLLATAARQLRLDLAISHERETILGTGGGLGTAAPLMLEGGAATMILLNADSLYFGDLAAAGRDHQAFGATASMLLQPPPAGGRYGLVATDRQGRVVSIAGRPAPDAPPAAERMFIGIHFFEPRLLERIEPGRAVDINADIYRSMIADGETVAGLAADGPWLDFGTPRQFLESALRLLADRGGGHGRYPFPLQPPGRFLVVGPAYVGAGADLADGVRLREAVVGEGCVIGRDGSLRRSLLMEGCRLGRAVNLDGCLVGPGVELPDRFSARCELLAREPGGGLHRRPLGEV